MYFNRKKKGVCVYKRPGPSKGLLVREQRLDQKLTHWAERETVRSSTSL